MRSQNMDPNLILLYECIRTVGTKKIDWKQVGKALGVNTSAVRMRYSRLESKMKTGGVIKSRITGTSRPITKESETKSKLRELMLAARRRHKRAESENESAVSSGPDRNESESNGEVKTADGEHTIQRRTRGVKIDLKDAFNSSDNDTDSTFDIHDATSGKSDEGDEDLSDAQDMPNASSPVKNSGTTRHFRRSGSPPLTPGRYARHKNSTVSPLTPPSSQESIIKTTNAGSSSQMSHDKQIKQDLSVLKAGMMLPLSNLSSPPTTTYVNIAGNNRYLKELDILESVERDDEEGRKNFELADEEMGDEGEDDDEEEDHDDDQYEKDIMGPPALPASKKSKMYACTPQ